MIYAYQCRTCRYTVDASERGDSLGPCPGLPGAGGCTGELTRLFVIRTNAVMQEHYNPTTNTVISSDRQFSEELKRQSEIASARTGMEHRFEPVDPTDKKALGVTDEGIDASNRIRREQGLPTFKT